MTALMFRTLIYTLGAGLVWMVAAPEVPIDQLCLILGLAICGCAFQRP